MKATSVIITNYKAIILQIKMKFLEIGVNIGNVQRNTENTIPLLQGRQNVFEHGEDRLFEMDPLACLTPGKNYQ